MMQHSVWNWFTVVDLAGDNGLVMYKTDKARTRQIDRTREGKAKYRTLRICGFVGATILGYRTANNMTKAREHDS